MSDPVGAYAARISAEFMARAAETFKQQGGGEAFGQSLSQAFNQGSAAFSALNTSALGTPPVGGSPAFPMGAQGTGDSAVRQVPLGNAVGGGGSFSHSLERAINEVSAKQEHSAETLSAFLRGENVELHQVMAATEEAQISLEMLIEVRNKFTEAYRSLSSMQG